VRNPFGVRGRYEVRSQHAGPIEFFIYDVIGDDPFGGGISARKFVQDLAEADDADIVVRINSPGGLVHDGIAMMNAMRTHSGHVTAQVDGVAASAAAFLVQGAQERIMQPDTSMMIHRAWGLTIGNQTDHRKAAEDLAHFDSQIAGIMASRSGTSVDDVLAAMDAETWYGAPEALAAGLIDGVGDSAAIANQWDLSQYANTPDRLLQVEQRDAVPSKRDTEKALRDAGFSRTAARAVVSGGWNAAVADPDLESLRDTLNALNQGS